MVYMINKNFKVSRINFLKTISRTDGFFGICKSELIKSQNPYTKDRCDHSRYGAIPVQKSPLKNYVIYETDDVFPLRDPSSVEVYEILYNEEGKFCLIFLKMKDINIQNKMLNYEVSCFSKTFTGLLKLINEWKTMTEPPFNSQDEIALLAKYAIESIGIPKAILNRIDSMHPDMQVFEFLKGNKSARILGEQTEKLPFFFYEWTKEIFPSDDFIKIDGEIIDHSDGRIDLHIADRDIPFDIFVP